MATKQQILQHISGHALGAPLQLSWQMHFTPVQQPRIPGRSAYTDVPFQINAVPPELCRQLLDAEWDASVLSATNTSLAAQFTADFNRLSQSARSEVARLNSLYDSIQQTNHGAITQRQGQWDRLFRYVIQNPESDLTTLLMIGGGSPSGF